MLVTLHDTKATAVIDSIGAQLLSFKDSAGTEYIWQRDPEFWSKCSPLLFPIVGNCRNNQTRLEGRTWEIPKHGFCREADFAVTQQAKTSAAFEIRDTEETKRFYPYSFRLSLSYTLIDGSLYMEYQVFNTEERTIYYCLGAHPGFNCPMENGASLEDYDLVFEKEETISSMVYDCKNLEFNPGNRISRLKESRILSLNRELFKDDAVYFDDLKSRAVSIINRNTGRGVEVSFPGFETVAFWSPYPGEAPFVCVEPWNGSAIYATEDDEFIHKNHVQTLKPGKAKSYGLSIKILNE
ncbi:aldose 1-epimerase family protein [Lacrimispora saccharolytica]|uniref:Aldose 1-epimerase n=1 Tax=Lacrimispora saccharolytica (strain ATCC 35040 / DSM 2544 / NRCC 2533 / WM1) TaxID=610130 RepID=D9R7U5_LACSW|nr:aldose 1-epimerase family protein [Lacrimispora saccharolytica]ADL05599.1 Aldose 1-epimerase [[Clostridium] saccharolyticum WM1]QRV21927.1 aldose 1-epimerase family protein [Lacrimispora saccharolytica]